MSTTQIGFIGTGVMGGPMVHHLLNAGYQVTVTTRTKEKAAGLLEAGASWAATSADVAKYCDIICTMVGFPSDVHDAYFGPSGIFTTLRPGSLVCDFTTSSPGLAVRIAERAQELGCQSIDAPVSGGDIGARAATLSIMCGGNQNAYERILPVLQLLGKTVVLQGEPGSGQHTKMCNQIVIAGTMLGAVEATLYARKSGLDPEIVLKSISTGAAGSWTLSNLVPRILAENFDPGFFVEHYVKDMDIALAESQALGLELPGLALARKLYGRLVEMGHARLGTQALYLVYTA